MSNVHKFPVDHSKEKDELQLEQASLWIAKLDRQLTQDEKQSFQAWLANEPSNLQTLLEVAKMWDKMDQLARLSDLFPQHDIDKNKKINWRQTIAASILVLISIGLYQRISDFIPDYHPANIVLMQKSYQTGVGESNIINLPDKSKLILNTNSFVHVKYTPTARIIELQRGELNIKVAHDKTRPLSVIASGKIIQAVGTAFNVDLKNDIVELIVTDGKVLISEKNSEILNIKPIIKVNTPGEKLPLTSMAVSKGEKVNLSLTDPQKPNIIKIDSVDIAANLSWQQGNLIFRGESLSDVLLEISRYSNIEFQITEHKYLKQVKVAGMFKTGDVTGLLNTLSQNFDIQHKRINSNKILLTYSGS